VLVAPPGQKSKMLCFISKPAQGYDLLCMCCNAGGAFPGAAGVSVERKFHVQRSIFARKKFCLQQTNFAKLKCKDSSSNLWKTFGSAELRIKIQVVPLHCNISCCSNNTLCLGFVAVGS